MKAFLDEDFILQSEAAKTLYHNYAENEPIFDFHNHLSPQEIFENKPLGNLANAWLDHDHYKWRAMRSAGVDEESAPQDDDQHGHAGPPVAGVRGFGERVHRAFRAGSVRPPSVLETEVHASREHAADAGDCDSFLEIKLRDGLFLLLRRQFRFFGLAGKPDEHDADEREGDAPQRYQSRGVFYQVAGLALQDRRYERAGCGTEAASDGEA